MVADLIFVIVLIILAIVTWKMEKYMERFKG